MTLKIILLENIERKVNLIYNIYNYSNVKTYYMYIF